MSDGQESIEANPTHPRKLADAVRSLASAISATVGEHKARGALMLGPKTYILRPNFSLFYTVDPTVVNFGIEHVQEDEWDVSNQIDFYEGTIKELPEFDRVKSLAGSGAHNEVLLRSFAFTVANASVWASNQDALARHAEILLNDLSNEARPCVAKVWLTGISVDRDRVVISDSLVLRRPDHSDLREKVPEESAHYVHALLPRVFFSCIADLWLPALYPAARQAAIDRLIIALRLFRVCSVASTMCAFTTDSFSPIASYAIGGPGRTGKERYEVTLGDVDAPALTRFLSTISPLVPSAFDAPQPKRDYLSLALHWYGEALLAALPPEGSVASATACLEALFLKKVQTEVSYRLGIRVSGLLRCFGMSPLDVQRAVRQSYDVRSKYVHGDEQKEKWSPQKLSELSSTVLNYARLALLTFCQLKSRVPREELLRLVDDSLLDDESRAKLGAICKDVMFCEAPT